MIRIFSIHPWGYKYIHACLIYISKLEFNKGFWPGVYVDVIFNCKFLAICYCVHAYAYIYACVKEVCIHERTNVNERMHAYLCARINCKLALSIYIAAENVIKPLCWYNKNIDVCRRPPKNVKLKRLIHACSWRIRREMVDGPPILNILVYIYIFTFARPTLGGT